MIISWRVWLSFCLLSCRSLRTFLRENVSIFIRNGPFVCDYFFWRSVSYCIWFWMSMRFSIFLRSTSRSNGVKGYVATLEFCVDLSVFDWLVDFFEVIGNLSSRFMVISSAKFWLFLLFNGLCSKLWLFFSVSGPDSSIAELHLALSLKL